MRKRNLVFFLVFVSFLKNLIWSGTVPLWHFPDEQAHFAEVQLLVERGVYRKKGNNLARDIYLSEKLLGTERDWAGKNKFTHHPEYNIEYTQSLVGQYEKEIKNFPLSFRKELVKKEAAGYPPLFYWLTGIFYRLVYNQDLITRVFVSRFASIIFSSLLVFLSFKIGELLFGKNLLLSLALAILVSFQPMLTFTGSGVNSDNLMNLLFTLVIYLSLKILKKPKPGYFLLLFTTLALGEYTKPHFKIAFLVLPFLLLFHFKKTFKISSILALLAIVFLKPIRDRLLSFFGRGDLGFWLPDVNPDSSKHMSPGLSFPAHFLWTIKHTIAEVVPWYWGVFKWLGVALPRTVNRILNRLVLVAAIGVILKLVRNLNLKKIRKEKNFFFLLYVSGIYFLSLTVWDWFYTRSRGFSLGMQGRYYFPTLAAHMGLVLIGLMSLVPKKWEKFKSSLVRVLCLGMVVLNFIGLYTVTKAYYQISNLQKLYWQVSQYKPWFFKGPVLFPLFGIYFVVLVIFLKSFLKIDNKRR